MGQFLSPTGVTVVGRAPALPLVIVTPGGGRRLPGGHGATFLCGRPALGGSRLRPGFGVCRSGMTFMGGGAGSAVIPHEPNFSSGQSRTESDD
jgi:hypothetical protein